MAAPLNRKNANVMSRRPVRVIQFGDGNFLRAFADWVIDILNEKTSFDGDVMLVRPLRRDRPDKPDEQDGLYHVVINGLREGQPVSETRLITCIAGAVNPYRNFNDFLKQGHNPDLQLIVSNTTEAGIAFNQNDCKLSEPADSFPGKLTQLLYSRYQHFSGATDKGLSILPCELIEKNGDQLKQIVLQYATQWHLGEAFHTWVTDHNYFCNTLVDRIVPGTPSNAKEIQSATGFIDKRMVAAEPFHLWVIEAPKQVQELFPATLTGLTVKFAEDLTPYRQQKVSILNGAHTAMVPLAYLRGLRTVKETVDDPFMGPFIRECMLEEIVPTLDLPREELNQFAEVTLERFRNPFICHELKSIALNSMAKFKVRVLPTILEYQRRTGKLPERLVQSFAALIRFYQGCWNGEPIPVNDDPAVVDFFKTAWKQGDAATVVDSVLRNEALWGRDLSGVKGLNAALVEGLVAFQS
jgi:tagaturonate reductase